MPTEVCTLADQPSMAKLSGLSDLSICSSMTASERPAGCEQLINDRAMGMDDWDRADLAVVARVVERHQAIFLARHVPIVDKHNCRRPILRSEFDFLRERRVFAHLFFAEERIFLGPGARVLPKNDDDLVLDVESL